MGKNILFDTLNYYASIFFYPFRIDKCFSNSITIMHDPDMTQGKILKALKLVLIKNFLFSKTG